MRVIKESKIRRKPVAVRPSRIRRDPLPVASPPKKINAYPTEREVWVVVIGVILFALALSALTFGISDVTAK
ncbi:MAG TPA: hypothetical protein VFU91_03805 [Sphingomicrobium sp.]|nr:hypothetical protein [Sphingomicrobium sp.]